jgi:hypothetical protein
MKKFLILTVLLMIGLAGQANAQINAYIGMGAGYGTETEATSLRFYGGVPASDFFTYFVDGGIYFRTGPKAADVNANLRFMIPGSDVFRPYAYTGINYTRFGNDYLGINAGLGAQFTAGPGFFFLRGQYTLGGLNMISAQTGYAYSFRTAVR